MDIRFVKLYDTYAALLSDRQRDIMELYYNEDESLSEIAENTGITRQGVRDHIKKTEAQLEGYEKALKLTERTEKLTEMLKRISEAIEKEDTELAQSIIKQAEAIL